MNIESDSQVDNRPSNFFSPRVDPPEERELSFYQPIFQQIEHCPQPKLIKDWDIFQDFLTEMGEFPDSTFQAFILEIKADVKEALEVFGRYWWESQNTKMIYSDILDDVVSFWFEALSSYPASFRPRSAIAFGIPDNESEEDCEDNDVGEEMENEPILQEKERKISLKEEKWIQTKSKENLALCFGDLDSETKSIFQNLHTGFVMKFMDTECQFETQVNVLSAYLQILSEAEKKNIYYGLLINSGTRTFFKFNHAEATLYQSETFNTDLEKIYIQGDWNQDEECFYRLLMAICWRLWMAAQNDFACS